MHQIVKSPFLKVSGIQLFYDIRKLFVDFIVFELAGAGVFVASAAVFEA